MARGRRRTIVAASILALGAALLGLSIVGVVASPAWSQGQSTDGVPDAYAFADTSADSVRAFFATRPAVVDFDYVDEATAMVSSGIRHAARPVGATENWLMWGAGLLHPYAAYTQDGGRILERRAGICSDIATALQEMLGHVDVESRIVRFGDHHIVLEVLSDDGWMHADADWGIALPIATADLDDHRAEVRDALRRAGWDDDHVEQYLEIVDVDVVDPLPVGEKMGETLWLFERVSWWAMWLLPLGAISTGAAMLRRRTASVVDDDLVCELDRETVGV